MLGSTYIPAAGYAILKSNSSINLEGLMIGNGLVDPRNMMPYSDYTYQLGFVDGKTRNQMAAYEEEAIKAIDDGDFLAGSIHQSESILLFMNVSGFTSLYNYLYPSGLPDPDIVSFATQTKIREAIHVGNATWNDGSDVDFNLTYDIAASVKPWLEELLEHYRVLIYNGQLDVVVAYPLTENYLQLLEWNRANEYHEAERKIWYVGDSIAGYAKSAGDFTEVLVRNAGHIVPADQPEWAFNLYNKFIFNQPISD